MARFGVDTNGGEGAHDIGVLADAGVEFVIARCGGSDDPRVGMYDDSEWERTYADCRAAGMPVGAFYYSTATSESEARDEAAHVLRLIDGKQLDYPVYLDFETGAQQGMGEGARRRVMRAWLDAMGDGWLCGVYTWAWLMPDGVDCELWTCDWNGTRPSNGCGMWQFGGESNATRSTAVGPYDPIDQDYCYVDYPSIVRERGLNGFEASGKEDTVPDLRAAMVEHARSRIGEPYYSMNYSAEDGYAGWMGTHRIGAGWGCAQFVAYCHNVVLGTEYVGSCYNFAGDALGKGDDQGGGEFEFVDARDAQPGDAVLYGAAGYDGTDYDDYGHIALYLGGGRVIGAMGGGKPGDDGYLNIGIKETDVAKQSLGGVVRYIRCKRLKGGANAPATGGGASYPASGEMVWVNQRVTVKTDVLNVRDKPSTREGAVKAQYRRGDVVYLDGIILGDGYVWGSYVGATSGKRRYVALGDLELAQ